MHGTWCVRRSPRGVFIIFPGRTVRFFHCSDNIQSPELTRDSQSHGHPPPHGHTANTSTALVTSSDASPAPRRAVSQPWTSWLLLLPQTDPCLSLMLSGYTNTPHQRPDPEGNRPRLQRPPEPRPWAQDALLHLSGASHQAPTKAPTAELCEGECACTPDESSLSQNQIRRREGGGCDVTACRSHVTSSHSSSSQLHK